MRTRESKGEKERETKKKNTALYRTITFVAVFEIYLRFFLLFFFVSLKKSKKEVSKPSSIKILRDSR